MFSTFTTNWNRRLLNRSPHHWFSWASDDDGTNRTTKLKCVEFWSLSQANNVDNLEKWQPWATRSAALIEKRRGRGYPCGSRGPGLGSPWNRPLGRQGPDEGCHLLLKPGHKSDTGLPAYHQGTMGWRLRGACQAGSKGDKALLSLNGGIITMVLEGGDQDGHVLRDKYMTEEGKLLKTALYFP